MNITLTAIVKEPPGLEIFRRIAQAPQPRKNFKTYEEQMYRGSMCPEPETRILLTLIDLGVVKDGGGMLFATEQGVKMASALGLYDAVP